MNNIDELRELKEVAKVHGAEEINFRSVADIKTIIEQADIIAELEKRIVQLTRSRKQFKQAGDL